MTRPWPLTVVCRHFSRRAKFVEWNDIASIERPRVDLRCRTADLRGLLEDRGGDHA
jgi:hypothetical protein